MCFSLITMKFFFFFIETVCSDLVDSLKSSQFTKIIWRQLQPLVEGRIPYAPNTTTVNEVIRMVGY